MRKVTKPSLFGYSIVPMDLIYYQGTIGLFADFNRVGNA